MSEQRVQILIRLLLRSSLIRIYTVCHSFYIFWRHYLIVKLNCFVLRITTVAGLGVPIFRVFTVVEFLEMLGYGAESHWKFMRSRPGPEVIKLFSCSTQLSMKF